MIIVLNLRGKQLSWECLKKPEHSTIKDPGVQMQTNSELISFLESISSKTDSAPSPASSSRFESQSQRQQTSELVSVYSDLTKFCDKAHFKSIAEGTEDDSCPDLMQKRYNNNLRVYVDICARSPDTIRYAFEMIERSIRPVESSVKQTPASEPGQKQAKSKETSQFLSDVEVFNRLMFALAEKGNVEKIVWCFNKMREGNIKPNLESYVAAVEALGWHFVTRGTGKVYNRSTAMRIISDSKKFNVSFLKVKLEL